MTSTPDNDLLESHALREFVIVSAINRRDELSHVPADCASAPEVEQARQALGRIGDVLRSGGMMSALLLLAAELEPLRAKGLGPARLMVRGRIAQVDQAKRREQRVLRALQKEDSPPELLRKLDAP